MVPWAPGRGSLSVPEGHCCKAGSRWGGSSCRTSQPKAGDVLDKGWGGGPHSWPRSPQAGPQPGIPRVALRPVPLDGVTGVRLPSPQPGRWVSSREPRHLLAHPTGFPSSSSATFRHSQDEEEQLHGFRSHVSIQVEGTHDTRLRGSGNTDGASSERLRIPSPRAGTGVGWRQAQPRLPRLHDQSLLLPSLRFAEG